ncbi:unnamed protein product [Rotaria sp. Silwood1]|nr:unnamed protein product [Rotaria sp. Silwood1]
MGNNSSKASAKSSIITNHENLLFNNQTANPSNQRNFEENAIIWLDSTINSINDNIKIKTQLRQTINYLTTFSDSDECVDYLTSIETERIYFIVSDLLGEIIVPIIHDFNQVESIYVYCSNKNKNVKWTRTYNKIHGVFSEMNLICDSLNKDVLQWANNLIPISVLSSNANDRTNQQEASFMYFQLLIDTLLEIKHKSITKKQLIDELRLQYKNNNTELIKIDEFEKTYDSNEAIKWYTRDSFLYRMLNKALRTYDIDILYKLGFFITDLYNQLKQLYSTDKSETKIIQVYRGQGIPNEEFEKLQKNIGGFLSVNNFLSASINKQIAEIYVLQENNIQPVLFEINIETTKCKRPFCNIKNFSYFQDEEEVLFSMATVFRIQSIQKSDSTNIWNVKLILNGEEDEELNVLKEHMENDLHFDKPSNLHTLGTIMLAMGEYDKAKQYSLMFIDDTEQENVSSMIQVYMDLGQVYDNQGDFDAALIYYDKALQIQLNLFPSNHPSLAVSYTNIGLVYCNKSDYVQALNYYKKALNIYELSSFSTNYTELAKTYNNISIVYNKLGDNTNALKYNEKSLEINLKSLPSNHPLLAASYNNIATVYNDAGDYAHALKYYELCLQILLKSLPPNHHYFATTKCFL